jgi:hypothetical protein
MAEKRRKEANEVLRKAIIAFTRAQNKQKNKLHAKGVLDRKAKNERR